MAGAALGIAYFAARFAPLSRLDIAAHHGWSIAVWFVVALVLVAVHESGEKLASGLVAFSLVILGLGCLGVAADELFVRYAGCDAAFSPAWAVLAERVSMAWLAVAAATAFVPGDLRGAFPSEDSCETHSHEDCRPAVRASPPTIVCTPQSTTREIVIVKIRCSYCAGLVDQGVARCPSCDGAM